MKNEKFFCKGCSRLFDTPKIYDENHGLDAPPYERVAVCPVCRSDDFLKFDTVIEKTEVAEKLLPAIMHLNRYFNTLNDVFGADIKNDNLADGVETVVELIYEMFDFMDVNMQRKIFEMESENDVNKILTYLKGGL